MTDHSTYPELLKLLLKYNEKLERYRHHIVFNSTYLKLNCIPKGFRIKSHNNINECDLTTTLKKCSKKLVVKTIGFYKRTCKSVLSNYDATYNKLVQNYPDKVIEASSKLKSRVVKQRKILLARRTSKYTRDGLDLQTALDFAHELMQSLLQGTPIKTALDTKKEEILSNAVIPPYDPINLDAKERELPEGLSNLCQRGPSFIPTPTSYDWHQLQKDFDRFRKSMRTQVFFSRNEPEQEVTRSPLDPPKPKTKWKPPKSTIPEVETFLNRIESDLFSQTKRKRVDDNLTREERSALNNWRKDHLFNTDSDLIIRQQDKGNRFIIVDKETDIQKAEEQIQRSSFQEVNVDPTNDHIEKVRRWTEKWVGRKEIDKNWKEFIINEEAQPGKNTPLYKTHKNNTPVRLLTTGCNTAIENLSRFLEIHSAPLTTHLPSRIKDTGHLLELIDDINTKGLPQGAILVSFDVVNMFPNIDNERGLQTLREAFDRRTTQIPSTDCLIEALEICLYNNNSTFNNKHLLQTNGTATGAPNSCSYSDLAVQPIDDAIFRAKEELFTELFYYGRYRDDCFVIWIGSLDRLNEFHDFINTLDVYLKFTMEVGGLVLCVLDLRIAIHEGRLLTSVYSKPTDSHLYLQADSCHQEASVKGILKGVALRLRRICSTIDEFDQKSKEYSAYLVARGHNPFSVQNAFEKVREKSIAQARCKVERNQNKKVIFVTKYNPLGPNIRGIIKKHSHILQNSEAAREVFPEGVMVASRREQNLRELLTRADPYSIKPDLTADLSGMGYKFCQQTCDSCSAFVMESNTIKSTATGKNFWIRKELSCETKNVVYVAMCTLCLKQGVGSTTVWKPRLRNYKSHIKLGIETCGIAKHFINDCVDIEDPCGYLIFYIVDCLDNTDNLSLEEIDEMLLEKEKFWIGALVTQHQGMNCSHDWNRTRRAEKAPK